MQNWKTTVNGILALAITILTAVLTFQVPTALQTPELSHVWLWVTAGCTLLCGVARAVIGFLQNDAPPSRPAASSSSQAKLGAWALIALVMMGTVPVVATTGCTGTQVINEINVVLNEADSVLAVADPSAPWVAQLKSAITALEGAEATWQSGGAVAFVDDALNTLAAVTAVIPLTAIYSPLIDVLVAGIEAVLAALPVTASVKLTATLAKNPHSGRYKLVNHWYHTPAGNLKANWNLVARQQGLAQLVLR